MATISAFRTALTEPEKWFSRLSTAQWDGEPIRRCTFFAESRISHGEQKALIFMPLSALSMRRIERLIPKQLHLNSAIIPRCEILRDEMRHMLSDGRDSLCDILYEPLPNALPLADVLNSLAGEQEVAELLKAIAKLREELRRADISHNNLREENIMIDSSGRLYPIRWYYATAGVGGDDEALDALCTKIAVHSRSMLMCDVESAPYSTSNTYESKYSSMSRFSEGLIAVEQDGIWGFVDSNGNTIIEPKYLWVNDFREGRAEVERAEGMGLINKRGEYIIPTIYRIVEYDPQSGLSQAYNGNEWLEFDYEGHPSEPSHTPEEITAIENYT